MTTSPAAGGSKAMLNGARSRGTARSSTRPIGQLDGTADSPGAATLGPLAQLTSADAVSMLAEVFNTMATRLTVMVRAEAEAKEALAATVNMLVAQRTRESTLLNEMGELLQACATMEEAHTLIGRLAGQIFPETAGAVFRISASRHLVERVASWGTGPTAAEESVFALQDCCALRRGRPHLVDDTVTGLVCPHLPHPMPSASLCIPLITQGEAAGLLHLNSGPAGQPTTAAAVTEAAQRLAPIASEHLALALANLLLRETLRTQSIRDELTGLYNRRFLDETLELAVHRAERGNRPIGVIMLDVDHFKRFNDVSGHNAGDALLRELGGLLRVQIRGGDIPCRFGGEEFVLILPGASLEDARRRAEAVREATTHLEITDRNQSLGAVTISAGVAAYPEHGASGEALVRAADAALYEAKAGGRNQVRVADYQQCGSSLGALDRDRSGDVCPGQETG
jgi:diguanylate cyclase (GGDEF)-like protein